MFFSRGRFLREKKYNGSDGIIGKSIKKDHFLAEIGKKEDEEIKKKEGKNWQNTTQVGDHQVIEESKYTEYNIYESIIIKTEKDLINRDNDQTVGVKIGSQDSNSIKSLHSIIDNEANLYENDPPENHSNKLISEDDTAKVNKLVVLQENEKTEKKRKLSPEKKPVPNTQSTSFYNDERYKFAKKFIDSTHDQKLEICKQYNINIFNPHFWCKIQELSKNESSGSNFIKVTKQFFYRDQRFYAIKTFECNEEKIEETIDSLSSFYSEMSVYNEINKLEKDKQKYFCKLFGCFYRLNKIKKKIGSLLIIISLEECSLANLIEQRGKFKGNKQIYENSEALPIMRDLIRGLSILQELRIIHGDIKPSNIMMSKRSVPVIIDFDVSDIVNNLSGDLVLLEKYVQRGTISYFSPEKYNYKRNKDEKLRFDPFKSDLYSLWKCFLEMVSPSEIKPGIIQELYEKMGAEESEKRLNPIQCDKFLNEQPNFRFKTEEYKEYEDFVIDFIKQKEFEDKKPAEIEVLSKVITAYGNDHEKEEFDKRNKTKIQRIKISDFKNKASRAHIENNFDQELKYYEDALVILNIEKQVNYIEILQIEGKIAGIKGGKGDTNVCNTIESILNKKKTFYGNEDELDVLESKNDLAYFMGKLGGSSKKQKQLYIEIKNSLKKRFNDLKITEMYADTLNNLSKIHSDLGKNKVAIKDQQKAIAIRKKCMKTPFDAKLATYLVNLGVYYIKDENYDAAEESFDQAQSERSGLLNSYCADKRECERDMMEIYENLYLINILKLDWEGAKNYLMKKKQILKKIVGVDNPEFQKSQELYKKLDKKIKGDKLKKLFNAIQASPPFFGSNHYQTNYKAVFYIFFSFPEVREILSNTNNDDIERKDEYINISARQKLEDFKLFYTEYSKKEYNKFSGVPKFASQTAKFLKQRNNTRLENVFLAINDIIKGDNDNPFSIFDLTFRKIMTCCQKVHDEKAIGINMFLNIERIDKNILEYLKTLEGNITKASSSCSCSYKNYFFWNTFKANKYIIFTFHKQQKIFDCAPLPLEIRFKNNNDLPPLITIEDNHVPVLRLVSYIEVFNENTANEFFTVSIVDPFDKKVKVIDFKNNESVDEKSFEKISSDKIVLALYMCCSD